MALFLDTTVLIDVLRGAPASERLRAMRDRQDPPYICAINVEEIARGIRPRERDRIERLFDGLRLVPLGREDGEQAGRWRRDYATRGVTLTQADCLIAAAAFRVGATLATGNPKDFPMKELRIEHWPVGR